MTSEYYFLAIELLSLQVKHCIGVADIMGFNPVQCCFLDFFCSTAMVFYLLIIIYAITTVS